MNRAMNILVHIICKNMDKFLLHIYQWNCRVIRYTHVELRICY